MASLPTGPARAEPRATDLLCLSHLRWDFVTQRPQHLMSRFARARRVFFWEEPVYDAGEPWLEVSRRENALVVAVPHLPWTDDATARESMQRTLLDRFLADEESASFVAWFYTPMALGFADHLAPAATVYDCMDELSAFHFAPPELLQREAELLRRADLVFTGGASLYEAKRGRHPSVHLFPSSIDAPHFARARNGGADPEDQASIPRPRVGFFGVIDERLDLELLRRLAAARPDWHLVLIGPVVKIDPGDLPQAANLHYLGGKRYEELPEYLAGWDVAVLPFARNDATRFISPTKTPEYLAAGRPVVSAPIVDVQRAWGAQGLVRIAETVEEWVAAIEQALAGDDRERWLEQVDRALAQTSWDRTWSAMNGLIEGVTQARRPAAPHEERAYARRRGLLATAGD